MKQPTEQTFVLLTRKGTTTVDATGTYAATLPNGMRYTTSNSLALLARDAGFFGGLPGTSFSSQASSGSLQLLGTSGVGTSIFSYGK